MYRYRVYGLTIGADVQLPELPEDGLLGSDHENDVLIRRAVLGRPPSVPLRRACSAADRAEQALLAWSDYLTIHVRGGREIAFDASDRMRAPILRQYMLGPALGMLLHQRSLLVLHASAVEVDGEAVVFVGHKGAGKSTAAAALVMRGYRLLADDTVAIDLTQPDAPLVLPAFPYLKLWRDAVYGLGVPAEAVSLLDGHTDKQVWHVAGRFAPSPVPLRRVIVLEQGVVYALVALAGNAALAQVLPHAYAPRYAGAGSMSPAHLQRFVRFCRSAPIWQLTRTCSLQQLGRALDDATARLDQRRPPDIITNPQVPS